MDFVYLQTFCEVARWGNFTHAADALGYAQSSVTTQIKKLEESYGVVLFERSGRKMRLTQAGNVLLRYAQKILELESEAQSVLSSQQTGTLTLATIDTLATFFLPPLLQVFRQMYPQLTLVLRSNRGHSVVEAVRSGDCDIGLLLDQPRSDPELEAVVLRKETFVIVAPPTSAYRHLQAITPSNLAHQNLLLTDPGCTYRTSLEDLLQREGIPYQVAAEFGGIEAIKQCVRIGLGIAFLPRITVQAEVEQGTLFALPLAIPLDFSTQVLYLKRSWKSRAFQDLLQLLIASASLSFPPIEKPG